MHSRRFYATLYDNRYRNPNGTMTAAALRARRPFAVRNALTGVAFVTFALGSYLWAYSLFTPDDFGDVPVPPVSDEELARLRKEYGLDKSK